MLSSESILAVIGGSSAGTAILIEEIGHACLRGELPSLHVRLHGRHIVDLQHSAEHCRYRLKRLASQKGLLSCGVTISTSTDLSECISGSDLILCQIRPGGMEARSHDEQLALNENIPGDEGLGPSGLSCYLRTRPVMDLISEQIARYAPDTPFLQMSSPLGLNVARAHRKYNIQCYGVCELPVATANKVIDSVQATVNKGNLKARYFGINHQSWLNCFVDARGEDCTHNVLEAIKDPSLVSVDPLVIRREGAVPVPYLKLYYHTKREVARQRAAGATRGVQLNNWNQRIKMAYQTGPDHEQISTILAGRNMDWYKIGVVPVLSAFLGDVPREVPLNLPAGASSQTHGVTADTIVELPCSVSSSNVTLLDVPPLPAGPNALFQRLVTYENLALALPEHPGEDEIAEVLLAHPLVVCGQVAARLAHSIHQGLTTDNKKAGAC